MKERVEIKEEGKGVELLPDFTDTPMLCAETPV
jgi:hypothetical protein